MSGESVPRPEAARFYDKTLCARDYAWKLWNRTRYYWPQAQSRKRAVASLRRQADEFGFDYIVSVPWWWPFGGHGEFVDRSSARVSVSQESKA